MEFKHKDAPDSPDVVSLESGHRAAVDTNGCFEVDGRSNLVDRAKDLGHDPVGGNDDNASAGVPDLTQYSEEDLVTMDYSELQGLGSDFEDIKGNWGHDKLEEALIRKRRGQVG